MNVLTDSDVNRRANFDFREHNDDVELLVGRSLGDIVRDVRLDSAATCAKTCVGGCRCIERKKGRERARQN